MRRFFTPLPRRRKVLPDWQRDARFALKGRNREFAAERRRHEGDGKLGVKVVAVAREDVVRLDRDLDVEVARLSAVHARLAAARHADALAVVDTGGNLDLHALGRADLAHAQAVRARI